MPKNLLLLLGVLVLAVGCSSPRFTLVYVEQDNEDVFHPKYSGQKAKIKVFDTEKEEYVPVSYFKFVFQPPRWGQVRELSQKKKTGQLTVMTLYHEEFNPVNYSIAPKLKRGAPYK